MTNKEKRLTVNAQLEEDECKSLEYLWWRIKWHKQKKLVLINNSLVWRGRKYDPQICHRLIKFFDRPAYTKHKDKITWKVIKEANDYPTFSSFRAKEKILASTWENWLEDYPEFREATQICKDIKRNALITNGLNWTYNSNFAKLIAMNEHGMSEKSDVKSVAEISNDQRKLMVSEYLNDMVQKWEIVEWTLENNEKNE